MSNIIHLVVLGLSPTGLYVTREVKKFFEYKILGVGEIGSPGLVSNTLDEKYASDNAEKRINYIINRFPVGFQVKPILVVTSDQDREAVHQHQTLLKEHVIMQILIFVGLHRS